jgi:hypothetical protein
LDAISDTVRYTVKDFTYDSYVGPGDYIRWTHLELEELPKDYLNRVYKWHKQTDIVEIWLEKAALANTFQSFLKDKHVRVAINRGYSSWTFVYENLKRLNHMALLSSNVDRSRQKYHILYFGDYDPSGKSMDKHMDEQLKFLLDNEFPILKDSVYFQRLAVTLEQIEEYQLPHDPDKKTRKKLDRDTRTRQFKEDHGGRLIAVELDALLAIRPEEFRDLVVNSVDKYYDRDVFEKDINSVKEHKEAHIRKLVKDMTTDFLKSFDEASKGK